MADLTKSQKKHLRQLANMCYEKEMSHALEGLHSEFKKWSQSEMSVWDLNDKVHEYHNRTARNLWKIYEQMNDPSLAVSTGLANGVIELEDIREDCREMVVRKVEVFQLRGE